MFDKSKFSQILKKISETYDNQRNFSKKSEINRTYLSQYMNMKLDKPPKPEILEKLANASNGITTYNELMQICGYIFITELTNTSFGIKPVYWEMIFGNVDKVKLSTKGATFLASLLNKGEQEAKKAEENNEKIFTLNLDPELLIPNTTNIDDMIEFTKIFCFFVCSVMVAMDINETEREQLIINVEDLLNNLPENSKSKTADNISKGTYIVPILGKIAAGKPILADEYIEGYLPVDPNIYGLSTSDELFYLKVSGESMNLKVKNGDYALIHKQDYAEDGDIIVAIVNGDDEATLKRYKKLTDRFVLLEPMSTDSSIESITIDLKDTNFKIIGKAIGYFGKF